MDYKAIINLMKEMNQTDLTKVEVEQEGLKICLEKTAEVVTVTQSVLPQAMAPTVFSAAPVNYAPAQNVVAQEATAAPVAEAVVEDLGKKIVSPMVGTFYHSPSPDKAAFVKVGDKVIYSKYAGTEVKLEEEEFIVVKQNDIVAVVVD